MREYKRPEFYVTEFAANEYVAACESTTIGASCAGSGGKKVTIKILQDQGSGSYQAIPVDSDGNDAGGAGMLYPTQYGYAFTSSIWGHEPVNGEYYPVSHVSGGQVGQKFGSSTLCDCVLTNAGNSVGTDHHHLMTSQVVSS